MQLLVLHAGTAAPMEIVYIFTHTTDVVHNEYNYVFEGEIINEIPNYYFMVTLGFRSREIIKRRERQVEQTRMIQIMRSVYTHLGYIEFRQFE